MLSATLISVLARSFLAGDLDADAVSERATRTLGRNWGWLRPLAVRYIRAFDSGVRPRQRDVVRFLHLDTGFQRAVTRYRDQIRIAEWVTEPPGMQPARAAQRWNLPVIGTVGDLADWLSLYPAELEWFADLKHLGYKPGNPKLRHYRYQALAKRSGGVRLIETPKGTLKALQRRLLSGILDLIPVHAAVHGFVRARSILSFAAPHVGQDVLLRMDLENFFPAFPAARINALFRTFGYPEPVADRLGGLCSSIVPRDVSKAFNLSPEARAMYSRPHLPQGAPTSPALANLMAYRLDCRLSGLARTAGATYTRYADDLAFSGGTDFRRNAGRFSLHVAAVALEEGFSTNHHKTRIMRRGVRQQLAGIVVNQKVNLKRSDLDSLEALLTNCLRRGAEAQNRLGIQDFRAHLQGRISFVEMINPVKGQRLRTIFDAIDWQRQTAT